MVEFPEPWGTAVSRQRLVDDLTDRVAEVLKDGRRSDGRERNAWLDSGRVAERVADVYRRVVSDGG